MVDFSYCSRTSKTASRCLLLATIVGQTYHHLDSRKKLQEKTKEIMLNPVRKCKVEEKYGATHLQKYIGKGNFNIKTGIQSIPKL